MNFTKFDITVLTTMAFAVIVMSLMFPALGLSDTDEATENDIPEYNTTGEQFNFSGDFPDTTQRQDSGTLALDLERFGAPQGSQSGITQQWISRPPSEGTSIELVNTSGQVELWHRQFSNSNRTGGDEYVVPQNEGEEFFHQNTTDGWEIRYVVEEYDNPQESNMTVEVSYEVLSYPANANGPFEFGNLGDVAQVLSYLAQVITWIVTFVIEAGINAVVALFNAVQYFVSLAHWLLSTYTSVISAAPGFASVFLMVPLILLGAEFAKIIMLAISLLPTT